MLDTNVVVSGVLRADGPPGRLLDAVLAGALGLLVDDRILLEYREVLLRPRFGLTAADVDVLLDGLRAEAELVLAPPLGLVLPDADDAPFLEVALAGQADALISGNRRHFPASVRRGVPLLSPAAALARLEPR